jgi:hypothetical protein
MDHPSSTHRWECLTPFFVFFVAFSFALAGVNPTFYADDSPETITACVTLGIAHPPGYPLFTLIGSLFSRLPLAHYPFRVNLFSASLAALVCLLLYGFLREKLQVSNRWAALFALFWLAGATTFPAALSAKTGIYQLTALFVLAILWTLFEGRLPAAGFLLGLSFANHWMTMAAFLPGFAVLLYPRWKEKGFELRLFTQMGACALLGLSLYLFLPLRAFENPSLNWGNPATWHNFVFDFLRSEYLAPEAGGGPIVWFSQWRVYLQAAFGEFGGMLLIALGGILMVRRYSPLKSWAPGLVALWASLVMVLGLYLNLPKDWLYLIKEYALTAHLFILLFSAWGVETGLSLLKLEWKPRAEKIIFGAFLLWLVGLSAYHFSRERQTDYTYSHDSVLNGFQALPRNALYFCKGDIVVFPAWYFQWVEHRRADVAVVGIDGLPMDWARDQLAMSHAGLRVPHADHPLGLESIPSLANWIVDKNRDRELYFSYNKIEDGSLPGVQIVPYGISGKGFLPGEKPVLDVARADGVWNGLRLRHLGEAGFPMDPLTRDYVYRDYGIFRNSLGTFYEDMADDAKSRLSPLSKAGDILAIQQDYQKSLDSFLWAEQWDPEDAQYAYNTGNACYHIGRVSDALGWYEKATRLNPQYTVAYFNWAVVALQTGDYSTAGRLFEKVLALQPDHAEAKRGLDFLVQKGFFRTEKQ